MITLARDNDVTKYQGSPVLQREAVAEQDHSLTVPAPPPSTTYQPVPTVRTPAPPTDSAESGLHRAVYDWPPEPSTDADGTGRDTVPSPPPEGFDDETEGEPGDPDVL